MRREDFETLLERLLVSVVDGGNPPSIKAFQQTAELRDAVLAAWDAQAAEMERLRVEVEALRVGVPLTAENAPRARVVEAGCLWLPTIYKGRFCASHDTSKTAEVDDLIASGATVLAWRKP